MKRNMVFNRVCQWIGIALVGVLAVGCAITSSAVDHAFGFDLRYDGQDAAVLDYRYGNAKRSVRASEWAIKEGRELYFSGVNGPMVRGDFLYVKWRNRNTGQIYEDTVDLLSRLPHDITDHEVYFMIYGPQLYVYLISPDRRPPDMPPVGPSMTRHRKTVQIYPDKLN